MLVAALGCGGSGKSSASLPAAICAEGTTPWTTGATAFRDASADWGIPDLGAEGVRISVTDIDGDGFPDIIARKAGNKADELTPGGLRQTYLLRNTGTGGFEDVTLASGILTSRALADDVGHPNEVFAWADVDNDGDLDAYVGLNSTGPDALGETSELYLNNGTGHFTLGPEDNPLRRAGAADVPNGASFVDVDRDGNVDLWIGQYNSSSAFLQDRLFRGDGTGRFTDITDAAGLTTSDWTVMEDMNGGRAHSRAWATAACDLNNDGLTELMVSSYGRSPNHLWQGALTEGLLSFSNRSVESGFAYDNDQTWEDNQFARCYCQANPSADGCADVPVPTISCGTPNWNHASDREEFRLGGNSAGAVCADIDNDGDLDLATAEILHWWAGGGSDAAQLLVSSGGDAPVFSRPGRSAVGIEVPHPETGWDEGLMTLAVVDFDNDGRADLYWGGADYPGNRGYLFHQNSPMQFEQVPVELGIDHNRSHGVAIADFSDHRGDAAVTILAGHLAGAGHDVKVLGVTGSDSRDYPDAAFAVGTAVAGGDADRGILVCGSGIGMAIAANKIDGVRAANARDVTEAEMSRKHNDANVLCLSADRTGQDEMGTIIDAWMSTDFEGGRHQRRVDKMTSIERGEDPARSGRPCGSV